MVIVGRSNIVGKPAAALLMRKAPGGNATVTVAHSRTADLGAVTRSADILVVAMGRPEMITGDMVSEGTVVIDVDDEHSGTVVEKMQRRKADLTENHRRLARRPVQQ